MPPFVLRKAARLATYRGHGNCVVKTQYGSVVIDHETVVTVLAPDQRPYGKQQIITLQ